MFELTLISWTGLTICHSHPTNAKPSDKDKSAFETIINNQSKRGWLPPITGIYYVGSQEDKKNKYFYYENE